MDDEGRVRFTPGFGLPVGVVAGVMSGLLGIGGGLIVVPILTGWLHVPIKRAIGTSLLAVLVTASVGVVTETLVAPSNLHWRAAGVLAAAAVAGAWMGTRLLARIPSMLLARLMALVLVAAALRMSGLLDAHVAQAAEPGPLAIAIVAAHAGTGLLAGVVGALFGIGGGLFAVPALSIIHPDWPFQACRATSLVMIVPASLAAALLHRRLANVDTGIARSLVPGAVAGAVGGVLLANRLPERPLELVFAALLVVAAARLARRESTT